MQKALRPVGFQLRKQRAVRWGSFGLMGGAAAALLYTGAAFIWPLEGALVYGFACCLVVGLLSACAGWLWPVSTARAARRADACGLKARMQTALELEQIPETPMSRLQRADALQALQDLDVKRAMGARPHWASLAATCGCLLLALGLAFVPNPQHEVLRAKDSFRTEMKKQAERLEKGAAEMEKDDGQAAMEARKLLGELARELRSSGEPRQALEAIDQTARKMEQLRQQDADSLRQALSQSGLDALAQAMEQQDEQAIQEALKQVDQSSLKQALAAAQAMGSATQALQAAANAMATGNLSQAASALMSAASFPSSSMAQGSALLQGAQLSAAQAGQSLGMPSAGGAMQALAALGAQSGNQSGQGSGSSTGGQGGGSGAGQGSTNQDAGYTSSQGRSSGGGGGRPPQEKTGEYETIYDPTRIGGDGDVAQERGTIGQGDVSELTIGGGAGNLGENVPYADVALEYQQSAVQSVQNANLPAYAQKWVESYFQSLLD